MQAELLPPATAENFTFWHLARMSKSGNPATKLRRNAARGQKRGDPLIGERLRTARENVDISQEKLSEDTGIGRSTIANIETAARPAGRKTLMELAEFFFVPVDYFTSRDDLMATALWILGRLPRDELEAWVKVMNARATGERLAPRD